LADRIRGFLGKQKSKLRTFYYKSPKSRYDGLRATTLADGVQILARLKGFTLVLTTFQDFIDIFQGAINLTVKLSCLKDSKRIIFLIQEIQFDVDLKDLI